MACGPVDFGAGRTPGDPCPGWLGCTSEDYGAVRQTLLLEHNALVRALNAFNRLIGAATKAKRWKGSIVWDGPTSAAWAVYEESFALLEKYPEKVYLPFQEVAPIASMLKMAMAVHAAACDVDVALVDAGALVPQKPEAPQPNKSLAQEVLDFARETSASLGYLAAGTILAILGYNYVTKQKANRW